MDAHEYQNQQKYHQMFVKNHYHSPKSRHMRRRARSECLSPSRSPQQYQGHHQQPYQERLNVKSHVGNGYMKEHQNPSLDLWRMHRREDPINKYRDYQHEMRNTETYKHRFHNLQIDGKGMQYDDEVPVQEDLDNDFPAWHQRRRFRASSESASHDYYYRESFPEMADIRAKRIREAATSPVKEHRSVSSHHVTNPRNNFSVLVNNNTTHYRYSPKSKVRSHFVGHKVNVVRVSSPLHKARMQMWKHQSSSTSNSLPSTESNSTPETPQVEDYDDDDDESDDEEDPPVYNGEHDMSDPEDNYESSLSVSSSERSLIAPAPTISTDCVQGGRVLSSPFAPSLFPFVPPYITFATYEEKGPEIPAIIHKQLKWKLTTITPLLVRKVILNTGFRLMKSE